MRQKRARVSAGPLWWGTPRKLVPASEHRTQAANDWNAFCFVHGPLLPSHIASDASLLEPKRDPAFWRGDELACWDVRILYGPCAGADPVSRESPSPLLATQLLLQCGLTLGRTLKHSPDYPVATGNGQRTFQGGATNLSRNPRHVFIRGKHARSVRMTEKAKNNHTDSRGSRSWPATNPARGCDDISDGAVVRQSDHRSFSPGYDPGFSRARQRRRIWQDVPQTSLGHGHSRSPHHAAFALAERPCRAVDWFDTAEKEEKEPESFRSHKPIQIEQTVVIVEEDRLAIIAALNDVMWNAADQQPASPCHR
jgi:hypothetical protein